MFITTASGLLILNDIDFNHLISIIFIYKKKNSIFFLNFRHITAVEDIHSKNRVTSRVNACSCSYTYTSADKSYLALL